MIAKRQELGCLGCGAVNQPGKIFTFHATYLWANQHGYKKRYFCHACGCVWEEEHLSYYSSAQIIGHWATICIEPQPLELSDDLPY